MKLTPTGKQAWLRAALRVVVACVVLSALPVLALAYLATAPGESFVGAPAPLDELGVDVARRLKETVDKLATEIGPRHVHRASALEAAATHIEGELTGYGYEVTRRPFEVDGHTVANLEARKLGSTSPEEVVVVGAHYDTVPGTPGADDNASGVAAMLEIARVLADAKLERSVWFVAFVNEEPPFFQAEGMGSHVYAHELARDGVHVVAMFSLETMGCFDSAPGSQTYIPPLDLLYPDRGNFIAFIGNLHSRTLLNDAVGSFREHAQFPSEALSAPEALYAVSFSDHWSFWQVGYPAIMVTDTAFLRNHNYHKPQDTAEKLDYESFARVVQGLSLTIADIASGAKR
ncbi:MAG: M20/M25/M40 family metallo-hydrolase [Myxococcales bacterium]|nr:M20/M25/M40 family metallo-hydrolase [Myxococcales bacterium]